MRSPYRSSVYAQITTDTRIDDRTGLSVMVFTYLPALAEV
jgi:hypothetical protein